MPWVSEKQLKAMSGFLLDSVELLLMGSQSIVEKVKTLQRNILGHIIV
jgi:hypothetical protein